MSQPNRLIHETSPYLLQHAYNPVDWYAWGEEALQKARDEDKPILLSVGYAACHWCHVMEHESFEDPATAALMNAYFVNIKVDREERPDIDSIYMNAVVAMTRQGGWPMTVMLMPDGTPFFGGTYFPPDDKAARYRMPSFKQIVQSFGEAYRTDRDELVQRSEQLAAYLREQATSKLPVGDLTSDLLDEALATLGNGFDHKNGGFGGAPKFPQPMTLEFLLRAHVRTSGTQPLGMLELTLRKMARGGIYDQLGGGFHRYSVDERWLVPHFEKMLYDNAQLARLYAETWMVTDDAFYRRIAEETLDYMLREMLHPAGGFFSTQDADSPEYAGAHNEEGAFFVWVPEQIREAMGADAALFCQIFDVTEKGNFEGRSILHMPHPLSEVARVTGVAEARLEEVVAKGRERLWKLREYRIKPARDEKVLTAWNGMALRAFALAAGAFGRADYLEVAQRNADFLLTSMRRQDGRLLRSWKEGHAKLPAYLEDYALLADGLLALYTVDGQARWLNEVIGLVNDLLDLFWDHDLGGFYDTAHDQETPVTRPRDISDNATPSGTSVAAELLLRLAALTGNDTYRARAEQILSGLTEMMRRFPTGFGRALCAADVALARVREVALVGNPAGADMQALHNVLLRSYWPAVVVAIKPTDSQGAPGDYPDLPLLEGRDVLDGRAAAYVCEGFACKLPVSDTAALRAQLEAR